MEKEILIVIYDYTGSIKVGEQDLRKYLNEVALYDKDWVFTYFIPLGNFYMAQIKCNNRNTYKR